MLVRMKTRILPLLAVPLLLTAPTIAQGSLADYERAAQLAERLRGLVLNESLDATWVSGSEVVFRDQASADRWRFARVDAMTGARADAFDHDRASTLVTELLGVEVSPDAIPIERFAADGDALYALLEGGAHALAITDAGVEAADIDQINAFRLEPTTQRRSRDDGGETEVLFINTRDEPVELVWLDRSGQERSYGALDAGQRRRQHTFAGHLWLVRSGELHLGVYRARAGVSVIRIGAPPQTPEEQAPTPVGRSPNGRWEAVVHDHNVLIRDLESGRTHEMTTDGTSADRYTGRFTWSPDSRRLVVIRAEPEQTHTVSMIDTAPDDQTQPRLVQHQYIKPGDEIERARPKLFDIESRREIPVAEELTPNPWSISRLEWASDSSSFYFLYNERGHQNLRVIEVNATTGQARAVIEERSETFIDYAGKTLLHRVPDTGEIIWMSERDGWNHLYLLNAETGELRQITTGEWMVRSVDRIDNETREIWFRAVGVTPGQDPYHVHHGRISFSGWGPIWLTEGDGTHEISLSPDDSCYIDTWSRVDHPPVHELRRSSDGSLVRELARADWTALLDAGWRPPERFVANGRDGTTDIWGLIYTPTTFDESVSYPIIENIYAGPHGHFVPKSFRAWRSSMAIAELGFVVVRIDGMGTNWRSKSFHDVCWKNLGDSGFPDRIPWIESAASDRPWMDLSRVGIYGGSAGGQSALRAMLAHPAFYHAAVADCGCHDNRMDKIWWNELWMGWPIGEHYEQQSNVTNAHKLEGDLMLVVGELDHNVDPASTMQVADALIEANKDFDLVVMTGVGHGAAETPYAKRRRADFFVRKLLGVEPRWTDPD